MDTTSPGHLILSHPLAAIDLETTGTDPARDRIVEVAAIRLSPGGRRDGFLRRLDPGVSIPAGATAVHGIADADVRGLPTFARVARDLGRFLDGADLAGFGVASFDLPLLAAEFARAGVAFRVSGRRVFDALEVYRRREPRDLSSAVRLYLGREHDGAHSAAADAAAALDVLDAQVGRYGLPRRADELHAALVGGADAAGRFRSVGGVPVFAFGRHRGRPLAEVAAADPGYLHWMLGQPFLDDAHALVRRALAGETPTPGA